MVNDDKNINLNLDLLDVAPLPQFDIKKCKDALERLTEMLACVETGQKNPYSNQQDLSDYQLQAFLQNLGTISSAAQIEYPDISHKFDNELIKLKDIARRMGEMIAYIEIAQNKLIEWKKELEHTVVTNKEHVESQLAEIRLTANELRELMTEAGVARWRLAAEQALYEGKEHIAILRALSEKQIKAIEESKEDFKTLLKKSMDRLDRASTYTANSIAEAVKSFRINDFKKLADQSRDIIEKTATGNIKRLKQLLKWFQWKHLALIFCLTFLVSLIIGLYINAEMPWESHKRVLMQRNAGQALINAWPNLSENERKHILEHTKKAII